MTMNKGREPAPNHTGKNGLEGARLFAECLADVLGQRPASTGSDRNLPAVYPPSEIIRIATQLGELADQIQAFLVSLSIMLKSEMSQFAARVDTIMAEPAVTGFEELFLKNQYDEVAARVFARNIERLATEHRNQINAERNLGAAVRSLVKEGTSTLRISRRAKKICGVLARGTAQEALCTQLDTLHPTISERDFEELACKAASRNEEACKAMFGICSKIAPKLMDPRGRKLTLESAVHEILLTIFEAKLTYNSYKDTYTDALTEAVIKGLKLKRFSPKSAHQRLKRAATLKERSGDSDRNTN